MYIDKDRLLSWLPRTRWWPKNSAPTSYSAEYIGGYVFLWVSDNHGIRYFVPLKKMKASEVPPELENRTIRIEDIAFVEAELVEPFLISAKEAIECKPLDGVDFGMPKKPTMIGESSNIVTVVHTDRGNSVVLKSYRRVLSQNNEVEMLRYLASMNFAYIPRVYAICEYRGLSIGLILEYVRGVDGGYPFYKSLVNMVVSGSGDETALSLGYEVGKVVARLHLAFAAMGLGTFDRSDVDVWSKRIERMAEELLRRIDLLHKEGIVGGIWVELADKRASLWTEIAVESLTRFYGLKKIVCHQDLHLGQMVYSRERGFLVTDFEGEHLTFLESLREGHGFRDIASIIRSVDYVVFSSISNAMGISVEETALKLIKGYWNSARIWGAKLSSIILKGYVDNLGEERRRILGVGLTNSDLTDYIVPWYTYRAFYEALYEATYRPNNLLIPLHILAWNPRELVKGIGL